MSEEEKQLHRVLMYAGVSLINVKDNLTEEEAREAITDWTDEDLDRRCTCGTLPTHKDEDFKHDDTKLTLTTPMNVYLVESGLGIINVVAPNEITALGAVGQMLDAVNERLGVNIVCSKITPDTRVHVFADCEGVMYSALTVDDLIKGYQTQPEE